MPQPEGSLTAAQHEILQVVWDAPASGATVTEIWRTISAERDVTRTTILNQVDRLEKRRWLRREKHEDGYRYLATQSREATTQDLAEEFVDAFFGGAASELVMSLLGSKKLKSADVARLRKVLDDLTAGRNPETR